MISLVFNFVLYLYNNIIIKFINLPILNSVKFIDFPRTYSRICATMSFLYFTGVMWNQIQEYELCEIVFIYQHLKLIMSKQGYF